MRALIVSSVVLSALLARDPEWRNPKSGSTYVRVPAGALVAARCRVDFPRGFWMERTEVTVRQFRRFVHKTGYTTDAEKAGRRATWRTPGFKQGGDHPVVYLSFSDALRYASWAEVDLPTEPEWEYARRAGASTRFYWGEELDDRYLWHRENSPVGTHAVGRKLPNAWGLYDMLGNASEYCKVQTLGGELCEGASAQRGGSWTRCPRYQMRDGRLINGIEASLPPLPLKCPGPARCDDNPWDDDRGLRCIKRISP